MKAHTIGVRPGKRLRFLTQRGISPSRHAVLRGATEATFLAMEAIGEQGSIDTSVVRSVEDVRSGYTMFFEGDVVVAKITPCFENGKGARILGTLNGVGFGTTELHVLSPSDQLDGRYLYYLTVSRPFRQLGEAEMTGAAGQKRVPEDFVRDFRVPILDIARQRAIADFLDAETARIDALIAAKENLLTILAEKRRALITQAVTRGLDPSAPMRDSGIPWLGEIPAHWEVVPLRWFARIGSGDFIQSSEVAAEPDEVRTIPVVGGNGVNGFTSVANVSSETVVIGRVGALCGNVHLVEGAAWVTDNALRLRDIRCFMARYLRLVLLEADLNAMASRTAQPLITGTQVMDLRLPLPPSLEQSQIVAKLDEGSAAIERLHMATSITLKLLRERREAVIAAAVTGQLDVGAK